MNTSPQKLRLLVVDDDASCRESLAEFFLREGFLVSLAASGTEAFRQLTRQPVDFSVMDVHMPGMTGVEVIRQLTQQSAVPVPPTVFMSSDASAEAAVRALPGVPVCFVPKPVQLKALRLSVHQLLRLTPPPGHG